MLFRIRFTPIRRWHENVELHGARRRTQTVPQRARRRAFEPQRNADPTIGDPASIGGPLNDFSQSRSGRYRVGRPASSLRSVPSGCSQRSFLGPAVRVRAASSGICVRARSARSAFLCGSHALHPGSWRHGLHSSAAQMLFVGPARRPMVPPRRYPPGSPSLSAVGVRRERRSALAPFPQS
jgi:hypothetical protein